MLGLLGSVGSRVAQLRNAHVEFDVRRVDVPQVLERHAVGAGIARQDESRSAHADRHVGLHRLLDLEAIRRDGLLAVGIDDLDVIEAVRCARQVELGQDLGAVHEIR